MRVFLQCILIADSFLYLTCYIWCRVVHLTDTNMIPDKEYK